MEHAYGDVLPPPGCRPRLCKSDSADFERRVTCARYRDCLTYAVRVDWESFTCARCPVTERCSSEQLELDRQRAPDLVRCVYWKRNGREERGQWTQPVRVERGRKRKAVD